jgi:hypothetical protein
LESRNCSKIPGVVSRGSRGRLNDLGSHSRVESSSFARSTYSGTGFWTIEIDSCIVTQYEDIEYRFSICCYLYPFPHWHSPNRQPTLKIGKRGRMRFCMSMNLDTKFRGRENGYRRFVGIPSRTHTIVTVQSDHPSLTPTLLVPNVCSASVLDNATSTIPDVLPPPLP